MNAKLYVQVEIAFWDFVIYALTESHFVRRLVRGVGRFTPGRTLQTALITAAVGLVTGFAIYTLAVRLLQG